MSVLVWSPAAGAPAPVAAPVVAVAGSRQLPPGGAALVAQVVGALVAGGRSLVVGCCVGADQAALSAAIAVPGGAESVRVLSAFGPGGVGAGPVSAVSAVLDLAAAGGPVSWWAGGGQAVPLRVRLSLRSHAVVSAASAGLVLFPSSPSSRGSWLAARAAAARGLPVLAFPLGFPAADLPSLGQGGVWVSAASAGLWASAWRWVPGQVSMF